MSSHFFVDIHCHPSIKAYARSFEQVPGEQSSSAGDKNSVWHRDAPSLFDKIKNYAGGLTNFIQSDASSLLKGHVSVVCLSFYPQEKAFFNNRLGDGIVSDALTALATEFGHKRINHLQQLGSYWNDLQAEMKFLLQQENVQMEIDGKTVSYQIARSYADIDIADKNEELGEIKILFIPTIEGAHIFDQVMNSFLPADTYPGGIADDTLVTTLKRVRELRSSSNGMLRPAFITFAHHFWNGLCGQARSLGGLVKCAVDQENGLSKGFTHAGYEVAKALLEPAFDDRGKTIPAILIDIKHMSRKSREDYADFLDKNFTNQHIPVIVSHGGVTGLSRPGGARVTPAASEGIFMEDDINFFDDELLKLEQSNGIFGIQLDERRIGSKQALRKARGNLGRRNILYAWSKLVWNQVRHIAEVLDMNGKFAWGIQSLGTDFDGIIDPINGYWTSENLDDLDDYLLKHAYNYLQGIQQECPLVESMNRTVTAEEVVDRIMTSNALNFFSRIY